VRARYALPGVSRDAAKIFARQSLRIVSEFERTYVEELLALYRAIFRARTEAGKKGGVLGVDPQARNLSRAISPDSSAE